MSVWARDICERYVFFFGRVWCWMGFGLEVWDWDWGCSSESTVLSLASSTWTSSMRREESSCEG